MNIEDILNKAKKAADENEKARRIADYEKKGANAAKTGAFEDAITWYTQSAELGGDYAMNQLGHIYYNQKKYELAYPWWKKSAENGNKNSQNNLGWCYQSGYGTTIDLKEAIRWFEMVKDDYAIKHIENIKKSQKWKDIVVNDAEKKAEEGDAQYMLQLAMWFQYGENEFPKDLDKAIYWFQKSAMAGNSQAAAMLNVATTQKQEITETRRLEELRRIKEEEEEQRRWEEEQRRREEEQRRREEEQRRREEEQRLKEEEQRRREEERQHEIKMQQLKNEKQKAETDPLVFVRFKYYYTWNGDRSSSEYHYAYHKMKRSYFLSLINGGQKSLRAFIRAKEDLPDFYEVLEVLAEER